MIELNTDDGLYLVDNLEHPTIKLLVMPSQKWKIENSIITAIDSEPVDTEKVTMAEAIIDMDTRITELENKLNGGM